MENPNILSLHNSKNEVSNWRKITAHYGLNVQFPSRIRHYHTLDIGRNKDICPEKREKTLFLHPWQLRLPTVNMTFTSVKVMFTNLSLAAKNLKVQNGLSISGFGKCPFFAILPSKCLSLAKSRKIGVLRKSMCHKTDKISDILIKVHHKKVLGHPAYRMTSFVLVGTRRGASAI